MTKTPLTSTQLSMLRIAARDVTRFVEHLSDEMLGELYTAVAAELDDREACYAPLHSDDDEDYDVMTQHSEVLAAFADCAVLGQHPIVGAFPMEGDL